MVVDQLVADLDMGRTVLVAALSNTMLAPMRRMLRAAGLAHQDVTARPADPRLVEALTRYLALDERERPATARPWTGQDIQSWWALCDPPRGGLRAAAAPLVRALPRDQPVPFELLADLWCDHAQRARALDPDPTWLVDAAKTRYRARLAHLAAAAERAPLAFLQPPKLTIGTVHALHAAGVAGDITYLCPDLTPGQASEWWAGDRARLTRLAFVATTQARLEVVRLAPATRYAIPDPLFPTERCRP